MRLLICIAAALLLAAPAAAQTADDLEQKNQTPRDGDKGMKDAAPGTKPADGGSAKDVAPGTKPADGVTPPVQITGVWQIAGGNSRGQTYRGAVAVRQAGQVYRVVWRIGRTTYWGVGILTGRTFSVAYQSGLAVYQVTPSGLIGRWVTMRGTVLQSENWRRQ